MTNEDKIKELQVSRANIIRKNKELRADIQSLIAELAREGGRLAASTSSLNGAQSHILKMQAERSQSDAKIKDLEESRRILLARQAELHSEILRIKDELRVSHDRFKEVSAAADKAESSLANVNATIEQLKSDAEHAVRKLLDAHYTALRMADWIMDGKA